MLKIHKSLAYQQARTQMIIIIMCAINLSDIINGVMRGHVMPLPSLACETNHYRGGCNHDYACSVYSIHGYT